MYIVLTHFYGYVKNFLEFVMAYMTVMRYSPDAMEQCKQSIFFIIYANQLCSTLQMGAF